MASPTELSLDAIRIFMIENGCKVTNHDLVKHFKRFLTNPETRDEARNQFKEYVNTLATIRNEEGEKCLVLKKRFRSMAPGDTLGSLVLVSPATSLSSSFSVPSLLSVSSDSLETAVTPLGLARLPPPYRPPPPPPPSTTGSLGSASTVLPLNPQVSLPAVLPSSMALPTSAALPPPVVPPRRKSNDRMLPDSSTKENKENVGVIKRPKTIGAETVILPGAVVSTSTSPMEEAAMGMTTVVASDTRSLDANPGTALSVKERTQRFNRLASESDLHVIQPLASSSSVDKGANDDGSDTASVTTLDGRAREWLVQAAQADHMRMTKLAAEDSRLARLKDPTSGYTALHWGAKHGNDHVIKLIAGTYGVDVNVRTHGGYTPAHIAMQFNHEDIFNLLVKVYGADPNMRDWSGRKPRQYQASHDTAVSADTFRKIKARKKQTEKELGFLRIGSLNMRVKRTTEAFSNFLGVGSTSSEKLHKTWGSADNIQQVDRLVMPPPKNAPIKKRGSRRGGQDSTDSHSTPSTPPSQSHTNNFDSDSDTACGFGSDWQVA